MSTSHKRHQFSLIILDADVIIELHKMGLWQKFVKQNDVYVAQTVVDEAHFYDDSLELTTKRYSINLSVDISEGRVTVVNLEASKLIPLHQYASRMNAPTIDDGEMETIAVAYLEKTDLNICLIDRAAIEYAILVGLEERCFSLETALHNSGLGRSLLGKLSEQRFREIVEGAMQRRVERL